jgi:glycosyltransferase involved in cell wall biosynthesis
MNAPSVALLIPCYNAALHLPRLIESVRSSSRPFSRILCYDDGSTDNTVSVARRLGIEILAGQTNRGVAHARNRLAAAVDDPWIHFHDADDLLAPSYLARLSPHCHDGYDVVSCDADWLDEATRAPILRWRYDHDALTRAPLAHLLVNAMGLNNSVIRRATWNSIGGCDESLEMWEDADIHIRLAQAGARFCHVPEVLTYSLRRANSFSHDYHRSWINRLAALERYASDPGAEKIASSLAQEAERAAGELAFFDDRRRALQAIALCRRFGGRPPTSEHTLLKFLKPFVPAYSLLRLQVLRRRRAQQAG